MSSAKSGYQQALVATGTPVLSPYVPETGPYHASSGPYAPPQSPAMQTFGVRSAYTKEVVLLLLAAVFTCASIVYMVLAMSSEHWIYVTSKQPPFPGAPWLTFDLGLLGGIATMHSQWFGKGSLSSVNFSYKDSSKYCPDNQCKSLEVAGLVCIILMSLSIAACFVAMIIELVVVLQLGSVLKEKGPFGPYVNYAKCHRNVIAASVSSILGTLFCVAAIAAWAGILMENQKNMPSGGNFGRRSLLAIVADDTTDTTDMGWIWPDPSSYIPDAHKFIPDFGPDKHKALPFGPGGGGHSSFAPKASDAISWRLGWIWIFNFGAPLTMVVASTLVCFTLRAARNPFTGYSSLV